MLNARESLTLALALLCSIATACSSISLPALSTLGGSPSLPEIREPEPRMRELVLQDPAPRPGAPLSGLTGLLLEGMDPATEEWILLSPLARDNATVPAEWVRLALHPGQGLLRLVERIPLKTGDGRPLDDLNPSGITQDQNGDTWIADEARPSLCRFSADGVLLQRFVPKGSKRNTDSREVVEALPAHYARKRQDRGFGGITFASGKIYAFLQAPMDRSNEKAAPGSTPSTSRRILRVLEFSTRSKSATGEFVIVLEEGGADHRISDAVTLSNGDLLVLEQTSGTGIAADKKLFRLSLTGATNLLTRSKALAKLKFPVENLALPEFSRIGIIPLRKRLFLDLSAEGYTAAEKAEGMAVGDGGTLIVLGDKGAAPATQTTATLVKAEGL